MKCKTLFSIVMMAAAGLNVQAQQPPYQNPSLSAHMRAVDLCSRLTLDEKAKLMTTLQRFLVWVLSVFSGGAKPCTEWPTWAM